MKLDKAIELGKEAVQSLKQAKFHDHADAVQLLIESARRIQVGRNSRKTRWSLALPRETEVD